MEGEDVSATFFAIIIPVIWIHIVIPTIIVLSNCLKQLIGCCLRLIDTNGCLLPGCEGRLSMDQIR